MIVAIPGLILYTIPGLMYALVFGLSIVGGYQFMVWFNYLLDHVEKYLQSNPPIYRTELTQEKFTTICNSFDDTREVLSEYIDKFDTMHVVRCVCALQAISADSISKDNLIDCLYNHYEEIEEMRQFKRGIDFNIWFNIKSFYSLICLLSKCRKNTTNNNNER